MRGLWKLNKSLTAAAQAWAFCNFAYKCVDWYLHFILFFGNIINVLTNCNISARQRWESVKEGRRKVTHFCHSFEIGKTCAECGVDHPVYRVSPPPPPRHHRELALGRISKHVNKPTSHLSTITNTLTHTSIWSNPPNRIVGEIEVAPKHYRKCIVETQQSWKKGEEPIGGILREISWAGCIPILLKDKVHP